MPKQAEKSLQKEPSQHDDAIEFDNILPSLSTTY